MKKRFLAGFLALLMVVTMLPAEVFAADLADSDFVIQDGVLAKYSGSGGDVVIPDGVTSIGDYAFSVCTGLTSVSIPSSVTSIGDSAFQQCSSLTNITIPNSVISIGDSAFADCTSLTGVSIPSSVTSIGEWAFRNCSNLVNITIPNSVTSLGERVFVGCTSLTSVSIPSSVTSIREAAFSGCSSLTSVSIQSGVTSIGDWAFRNCSNLASITIPDSVTSIGERAFAGCTSLTSVNIPFSVTSLGESAFASCTNLTSVSIESGVTSIKYGAFYDCTNLTSVSIPSSVTSIGGEAFYGTPWLGNQGEFAIVNGILIAYQGSGGSVSIPSTVTSIGEYAFHGCTSLTSVSIPSSVASIGDGAFRDCSSLINITIPNGVTSIEWYMFWSCTNLTSVSIPSSVTRINGSAFYNCTSLTDVYYGGSENQWGTITVNGGNTSLTNATIHYNSTDPSDSDFVIENGILTKYKGSGGNVVIPDGVTGIGDSAFKGHTSLTSVSIPSSVTSIGVYAFFECVGLTSVSIPPSVTHIGYDAFNGCVNLTSVSIPNVTKIENHTFKDCASLTSVSIPSSVTDIGVHVFNGCTSLANVSIPSSVTRIGYNAFDACNSLTDVYYDGSESQWGAITVEHDNEPLINATIHYNGAEPEPPDSSIVPILAGGNILGVSWDDQWFNNRPLYNHDLAVTSAALSWSAYNESEIDASLSALGFDVYGTYNFSNPISNLWGDGTVGCAIAKKTIFSEGTPTSLIAIVVRGTPLNWEWASNLFDSGWVDGDSGFEDAARIILNHLNTYLHIQKIDQSDNVKFLITGHSRGGIVANLIAAELTQHGVLNGAVDRSFGVDNVFAYTFASPRPSSGAPELPLGNIYNIINSPDPVPTVPPTKSARYGLDLILPCKKHFNPYYTKESGKIILHTYSEFWRPMQETYYRLTGKEYDSESYIPIWDMLSEKTYFGYALRVHGIAAYYSWMVSHTAEELFGSTNTKAYPTFKHIQVACPVDVYVYDEAGNLLLSVENDAIVVDELAAAIKDGIKDIYLPTGQEYDVRIVATDIGSVDYSVEELETSGVGDETLRTVSFDNIEIVTGDVLTGKVDDPFSIPAVDYALTKKSGDTIGVILPDSDSSSAVSGFAVTFNPNGGRLATETVAIGEDGKFAQLPTASRSGYTFNGWYTAATGGDRITTDTVFNSDTTVYAQWTYVGTSTPSNPTTPSTSSNPGGWYPGNYNPPATSYSISVPSVTGGTVSVSPASASAGSTVTVTTTPDAGYELAALTVSDTSGKTIDLTNKGNGQYSFKMPSGKVSLSAEFRFVGFDVPWSNPFADVSLGDWYYDAVKFVSVNGLMNGAGDGFFAPNVKLSRAMLAEILYNKEGRPAVTGGSAFTDVQPGAWFADAVAWAAGKGIITGYGNGQFGPDDDITREQVAVMLYRYAGSLVPPNLVLTFSDVYKVSDWAQDAVRWAVDQGILNGKGNGILDPTGKAIRAEAAQILKNYLEK